MNQRVITGVIAASILFLFLWLNGWWLAGLLAVLTVIGCIEFFRLAKSASKAKSHRFICWLLPGFVYICAGIMAFFGIRQLGGVLWLLLIIWSTDIAAYEIGRRFGKTKLAPSVSPNKTWEGSAAGAVAAIIFGGGYATAFMDIHVIAAVLASLVLSAAGQIGDLVESKVKRVAGVKDSGKIFPGHGGMLDRCDSILLASMLMYLFLVCYKGV